mgnify:CR=1 FL=1
MPRRAALFGVARKGALFRLRHGTEIEVRDDDEEDHQDREERVKVPRNGRDEGGHVALKDAVVLKRRPHGCGPGGNRRDDAHRRRGRIDDVGELCPGDTVVVAHRAHDGADRQTIEVVVDEDEDPESARRKKRAAAPLDLRDGPLAVCLRAARHGDHVDERAEKRAKDQDVEVHLVAHGRERALERSHEDVPVGADRVDERAREDADQKRRQHFLRRERKRNGHDRRNDGKPTGFVGLHCCIPLVREDAKSVGASSSVVL